MDDLAALRDLLAQQDKTASAVLESLMDFETQDWVTIFRDEDRELRVACLLRLEDVDDSLANTNFDLSPGDGAPGFTTFYQDGTPETRYLTAGDDGAVPLVFSRRFSDRFPHVVELAEDFRLFWDLYEDTASGRFLFIDEIGDEVTVAERRGGDLVVRKSYLRRYQAARQLALVLQVVFDQNGGEELAHLKDENHDIADDGCAFLYHGGKHMFSDGGYFTRLIGKRIILPPPVEKSGVWPYRAPKQYESFIIGTDEEGDPITHTSDPEKLANYFGKNPEEPHYLTSVFFNRNVLDKYYTDPQRYQVRDGYLSEASSWGVSIDNALADHVAVFLGDLGRDLPFREQQYWKPYNVPPAGGMSETAIRRSFLAQFADSDRVEHRFVKSYRDLNATWLAHFGWPLYLPLHEGDEHITHSMHVPTNKSFSEFDDQLIGLAKLVVDSLNEPAISTASTTSAKDEKGIAKLKRLFGEHGIESSLCTTLAAVQGKRSRSSAHRKGGTFDLGVFLDGAVDLPALFTALLEQIIESFDALVGEVANLPGP